MFECKYFNRQFSDIMLHHSVMDIISGSQCFFVPKARINDILIDIEVVLIAKGLI